MKKNQMSDKLKNYIRELGKFLINYKKTIGESDFNINVLKDDSNNLDEAFRSGQKKMLYKLFFNGEVLIFNVDILTAYQLITRKSDRYMDELVEELSEFKTFILGNNRYKKKDTKNLFVRVDYTPENDYELNITIIDKQGELMITTESTILDYIFNNPTRSFAYTEDEDEQEELEEWKEDHFKQDTKSDSTVEVNKLNTINFDYVFNRDLNESTIKFNKAFYIKEGYSKLDSLYKLDKFLDEDPTPEDIVSRLNSMGYHNPNVKLDSETKTQSDSETKKIHETDLYKALEDKEVPYLGANSNNKTLVESNDGSLIVLSKSNLIGPIHQRKTTPEILFKDLIENLETEFPDFRFQELTDIRGIRVEAKEFQSELDPEDIIDYLSTVKSYKVDSVNNNDGSITLRLTTTPKYKKFKI